MLVLFVMTLAIGVNAQEPQKYRAEIPFSFEAAGKQYAAGQYSVGPLSQVSRGGIAIRNVKTGNARVLGLTTLDGNHDWSKPGTLTFLKINGQYRLSQISTATFVINVKDRRAKMGDLAKAASPMTEVVAIKLN